MAKSQSGYESEEARSASNKIKKMNIKKILPQKPFFATVNGEETTDRNRALSNGDEIYLTDGTDVVEDYDSVEEVVPCGVLVIGVGALCTFEEGTPKIIEHRTGRLSGAEVDRVTQAEEKLIAQWYTPDVGEDKVVALTFDEGPSSDYTAQILDVLARNDAKATFFCKGANVEDFPDMVQRERDEGHQVASNTYDCLISENSSDEHVLEEVRKGFSALDTALQAGQGASAQQEGGSQAAQQSQSADQAEQRRVVRFPNALLTTPMAQTIADEVDAVVGWNVDSGDWLTYTPEGYFNGSEGGINKFVHLVNGMEVSELGQYAETLFRPDLVAAKIRGEDISKEEGTTSLAELVSTGEAPLVSFVNPPPATNNRDITVNFNVQNMGGGIGSVYLKINGKVIQLADGSRKLELVGGSTSTTQKSSGKTTQFSHLLTLQNGENTLEAYATNSAGKIESLHATATITWQGKTAKPNLYVLAVGVNKYRDRSLWLNYAVPDATSIADQFRSVKGNLYQSINVTSIFDGDVTANGISSAFNSLASKVGADDVFIFYLSGHGTTHTDGDYYFIPVDFRFRNAQSVPETAISKHFITENLSKIKAQKSLVMLDTCNSGAFISTGARGMAEKTAIDRLSRATGQATIAASSDTQSAMEGYEGHGIFTYVILEGLSGKADTNKDGYVSLSELSAYAEEKVPDYSYAKWGYEQYPQVDLRKQSNFPLVGK